MTADPPRDRLAALLHARCQADWVKRTGAITMHSVDAHHDLAAYVTADLTAAGFGDVTQARATLLAEMRKGVIGLFTDYFLGCGGYGCSDDRTRDTEAVLRLLDTTILANAGKEADRP